MLNIQCRLCSSSKALISLFGGKCRGSRDYIRKLVDVTTGIKFQKNDACKCICFSCTIQIYNFYIFKTRSVENEASLQAYAQPSEVKSNKTEVKELDDIILPNVEELKETLAPWLISKQEYCDTANTEDGSTYNARDARLIENSTQCDSIEQVSKGTQIDLSSTEASTQTRKIATKTLKIQCELLKKRSESLECGVQTNSENASCSTIKSVSKESQCELPTSEVYTQTKKLLTRTMKIQCTLEEANQGINESKTSTTQADDIGVRYFNKGTQQKLTVVNAETQTNKLLMKPLKTLNKLATINRSLLKENAKEFATQTELDGEINYPKESAEFSYDSGGVHLRSNLSLIDIKHEVASPSPPILSPIKCLNIETDKNTTLLSPISAVSPRSSNLLTIKNKIQSVVICKECDQTVYSKNQYKLHRKIHMRCNFCKKKFPSVRKTKLHIQNDCDIQKLVKVEPVVSLIRLENVTNIQEKYPTCLQMLKDFHKTVYSAANYGLKKNIRIRSRSISDIDSFINCTSCKGCISVLKGISIGVDKSIQTNMLFDKDLIVSPLKCLYKTMYVKRNLRDDVEDNIMPFKKIKSSPSVNI